MLLRLATSTALTIAAYVLYRVIRTVYAELTSLLRHLRGPNSAQLLVGNFLELRNGVGIVSLLSVRHIKGGVARLEILSWLGKVTLDIIGLAGFNHKINALGARGHDQPDEFAAAFETLFSADNQFSPLRALQGMYPIFRYISTEGDRVARSAQATMMRIGRKLLADSKQNIAETGTFETGRARDLLNLLVRANTSKEIPANQQLSDEDVLAQAPNFLMAGHETGSTAVTWALFALTQNKAAQNRLRAELRSVETENPTVEELNGLPYLDCVVRETLRVHAPVTVSVSLCDDIFPLSSPCTDTQGNVHENLRYSECQILLLVL
ncbi:cytochrome P450 [Mycena rosella]|uniref:Cytochrome P450 n=1 Tax=Mycena rosella TaxID=1033263 RepID=A0AAD7DT31_MYCRO|nr:cytochrome P450 [Mycena rosella]